MTLTFELLKSSLDVSLWRNISTKFQNRTAVCSSVMTDFVGQLCKPHRPLPLTICPKTGKISYGCHGTLCTKFEPSPFSSYKRPRDRRTDRRSGIRNTVCYREGRIISPIPTFPGYRWTPYIATFLALSRKRISAACFETPLKHQHASNTIHRHTYFPTNLVSTKFLGCPFLLQKRKYLADIYYGPAIYYMAGHNVTMRKRGSAA